MKQSILLNKKGTSMVELLAYVILYGTVMSLLATMVFFIATTSQKTYEKSRLNIENVTLFSESLAVTTNLMADNVELQTDASGKKSIMFWKKYDFISADPDADQVDRKQVETDKEASLASKVNRVYFSFDEDNNDIVVKTTTPGGTEKSNALSVSNVTLSDVDFDLIVANEANSFVRVTGTMTCNKRSQSFSYIIPVFTTTLDTE